MTDDLVDTALALAQLCGSVEALATGITSITCVDLVSLFLAREDNLVGVDDDDVVATVYCERIKATKTQPSAACRPL